MSGENGEYMRQIAFGVVILVTGCGVSKEEGAKKLSKLNTATSAMNGVACDWRATGASCASTSWAIVARARTEGLETNVRYSRGSADFSLGYDYLRARDLLTGRTLDGRATHTARAALSQRLSVLGGLSTDLSTRYISAAQRTLFTQQPFLSVDGQLRLGVQRSLELSIAVTNLFDQRPGGWTSAFQRQLLVGLRAGASRLHREGP